MITALVLMLAWCAGVGLLYVGARRWRRKLTADMWSARLVGVAIFFALFFSVCSTTCECGKCHMIGTARLAPTNRNRHARRMNAAMERAARRAGAKGYR